MRFSQSIPHLVVLPWGICARLLLWEWSRAWRKRMLLVLRWQNLLPRRVESEPKAMIKIKTGFNLAIYLSVFSFCVMRFLACLHHHPGAVHRIGFLIDGGIDYVWSHFLGLYCVFNVDILLDWCFSS